MPDNVVVTTASAGVPIAVENIGSTHAFQLVKLVGGQAGSTVAIPGDSLGLGVQFLTVQQVNVSQMPPVSGTVAIQPGASVTIQQGVSVSIQSGVSVTIQQGASVSAVVSGSVSLAGVDVTTGTSISASSTALAVVLKPGATIGTVLGTQVVSVVPGLSVSAAVSGTVTISPTILSVNTAATVAGASITIQQGASVTIQQGASVSAVVSGTVSFAGVDVTTATSISASSTALAVVLKPGATIGTILGTQVVSVVPGLSVSAAVSGTVTISPTILTVNTATTVAGASITIQQGVSVSAVVSGTVSFGGVDVTTATSISASSTALAVVLKPGATIGTILGTQVVSVVPGVSVSAQVSGTVAISGTGLVSVVPGVSVTIQQGVSVSAAVSGTVTITPTILTVNTAATVAGASVTIQQGVSVSAVVSGSVSLSGTGLVSVVPGLSVSAVVSGTVTAVAIDRTTAPASISATGGVIWIAGGQSTTAFPVVITGTVTAGAGTTVVSVTGVVQVAGTVEIKYSTTAPPGAAATGGIVWVANPGAGVATTVLTVNTAATVAGASVTIQQGASVSAVVSGTVTVNTAATVTGASITVQQGISVSAVVSGTVTVAGSVALSGTGLVSVVPGLSVSAVVSGIVSVVGSVAISGTGLVSVVPGVSVSVATVGTVVTLLGTVLVKEVDISVYTTGLSSGTTGIGVWPGTPGYSPVALMVSSTAMASGATMLFTVYTGGTSVAAGTSAWAVPAGKTFRIQAIQAVVASSAVVAGIRLQVLLGTAAVSVSVTSTVGVPAALMVVVAGTQQYNLLGIQADVLAGTTVGLGGIGGTAYNLGGMVVLGYLF